MRETHQHSGDHYIPGDYYFVCDVCGLDYRRSDMRERWDKAWVCEADWEPRNPQDYITGISENVRVPVARPVPPTNNMITSWGESDSYETFTSSDQDITSAINTAGNGSARSNDTGIVNGTNYVLSITLELNSGEEPSIITGTSAAANGVTLDTISNGPNQIKFEAADSKSYIYITNTADSNFSATFNLTKRITQDEL